MNDALWFNDAFLLFLEDDDRDSFEDNYLVESLDGELSLDSAVLNLKERTKDVSSVVTLLIENIDHHYKEKNKIALEMCCNTTIDLVPFLSQYVLVVEFLQASFGTTGNFFGACTERFLSST